MLGLDERALVKLRAEVRYLAKLAENYNCQQKLGTGLRLSKPIGLLMLNR